MGDDGSRLPVDPDLVPFEPVTSTPAAPATRRRRRRPGAQLDVVAAISVGGMVGASARYGVAWLVPTSPHRFPWATFWTNVSGSFLLGFLLVVLLERFRPTRLLRPFLATGVLGAFTTMSTYQVETALLVKDGHAVVAVIYALGSLVAGVALAAVGLFAGRLVARGRREATS